MARGNQQRAAGLTASEGEANVPVKFKLSTRSKAHGRISGMSYPSDLEKTVSRVLKAGNRETIDALESVVEKKVQHYEKLEKEKSDLVEKTEQMGPNFVGLLRRHNAALYNARMNLGEFTHALEAIRKHKQG